MAQDCLSSLIANSSLFWLHALLLSCPQTLCFLVHTRGFLLCENPSTLLCFLPSWPFKCQRRHHLHRQYHTDPGEGGEYRAPPPYPFCFCPVLWPHAPCPSQSSGFHPAEARVIAFIPYPQAPVQKITCKKPVSFKRPLYERWWVFLLYPGYLAHLSLDLC